MSFGKERHFFRLTKPTSLLQVESQCKRGIMEKDKKKLIKNFNEKILVNFDHFHNWQYRFELKIKNLLIFCSNFFLMQKFRQRRLG